MNLRLIIFIVIALCIIGAGVFVWFTWPSRGDEPAPQEPALQEPAPRASTYASTTLGYSITYPLAFVLETNHVYKFSSSKSINGFKVTIPESMATGTNLSNDSYVSVEQLPNAKLCTGDIFLTANVKAQLVTEGATVYSVASSTGAAAGNRYEEWTYALKNSKPCTPVRYYIHSTNIGSYPAGTVREFDRAALITEFDQIRRSLQKI